MRARAHTALSLLLLSACASYQGARPIEAVPQQPELRDRYELWSQGTGHQLHSLRLTPDSVSGVPWWNDPQCDSCRVAFARPAIDSVRSPEFDKDRTTALAGGVLLPIAFFPPLMFFVWWALHGFGSID